MSKRTIDRQFRNRLSPEEIAEFVPYPDVERPKTRGDCWDEAKDEPIGPRPCPFAGCKYNMFLIVKPSGIIEYTEVGADITEVKPDQSCVLDVADGGGETLESIGEIMKKTRERIRQIEERGTANMRAGWHK